VAPQPSSPVTSAAPRTTTEAAPATTPPLSTPVAAPTVQSTVRVRLSGSQWRQTLQTNRDATEAAVRADLAEAFRVGVNDVSVDSMTVGSLVVVARVNHSLAAVNGSGGHADNTTRVAACATFSATGAVHAANVPSDAPPEEVSVLSAAAVDVPLGAVGPQPPTSSDEPLSGDGDDGGMFAGCAAGCQIVVGSSVVAVVVVGAGAALFVTARRRSTGGRQLLPTAADSTDSSMCRSKGPATPPTHRQYDDDAEHTTSPREDTPMVVAHDGARVFTPDAGGVVFPSPFGALAAESPVAGNGRTGSTASIRTMTPLEAAAFGGSRVSTPGRSEASANAGALPAGTFAQLWTSRRNSNVSSAAADDLPVLADTDADGEFPPEPDPRSAAVAINDDEVPRPSPPTLRRASSSTSNVAPPGMSARDRVLMLRSRTRAAASQRAGYATAAGAADVPLVLQAQVAAAQARQQQLRALAALNAGAAAASAERAQRRAELARVNSAWDAAHSSSRGPVTNPMAPQARNCRRVRFLEATDAAAAAVPQPTRRDDGLFERMSSNWADPAWPPQEPPADSAAATDTNTERAAAPTRRLSATVIDLIFDGPSHRPSTTSE